MTFKTFLFICSISLISLKGYCQTSVKENKVMETILNIKYSNFIGKEVYNLLMEDGIREYKSFTFVDNKPFVLSGAIIVINSQISIEIFVSDFKYQQQSNQKRVWDKSLFYKENISRIKVYVNNECKVDEK